MNDRVLTEGLIEFQSIIKNIAENSKNADQVFLNIEEMNQYISSDTSTIRDFMKDKNIFIRSGEIICDFKELYVNEETVPDILRYFIDLS